MRSVSGLTPPHRWLRSSRRRCSLRRLPTSLSSTSPPDITGGGNGEDNHRLARVWALPMAVLYKGGGRRGRRWIAPRDTWMPSMAAGVAAGPPFPWWLGGVREQTNGKGKRRKKGAVMWR